MRGPGSGVAPPAVLPATLPGAAADEGGGEEEAWPGVEAGGAGGFGSVKRLASKLGGGIGIKS